MDNKVKNCFLWQNLINKIANEPIDNIKMSCHFLLALDCITS